MLHLFFLFFHFFLNSLIFSTKVCAYTRAAPAETGPVVRGEVSCQRRAHSTRARPLAGNDPFHSDRGRSHRRGPVARKGESEKGCFFSGARPLVRRRVILSEAGTVAQGVAVCLRRTPLPRAGSFGGGGPICQRRGPLAEAGAVARGGLGCFSLGHRPLFFKEAGGALSKRGGIRQTRASSPRA